jgi:DNA-directed RNA polymerase beta subunit
MPIMLQSKRCHLRQKTRAQLIRMGEEPDEFGGIFLCNGIERIVRLLVQQRRHYIMALNRSAYRKRGPNYTPFATMIRCVTSRNCWYLLSELCERQDMQTSVMFALPVHLHNHALVK